MRWRLRAATATTHERIHTHAGFEAAAAGTIEVSDYRRLLVRLYGFHRPFEDVARSAVDVFGIDLDMSGRARSPLLLADLQTIGLAPNAAATLPSGVRRFAWRARAHSSAPSMCSKGQH